MTNQDLLNEINTLPTRQRMLIAEYILESLHPNNDSNIQQSWKKEVQRRMNAIEKGQSQMIPREDLHNELYKLI